jgi:hypothetical protein
MIIKVTSRLIVPFVQLFALYVIAHGHHSPGGGFQGGVIFGAAIILYRHIQRLARAFRRLNEKAALLASAAGCPDLCRHRLAVCLLGGNFLDYSMLAEISPHGCHHGAIPRYSHRGNRRGPGGHGGHGIALLQSVVRRPASTKGCKHGKPADAIFWPNTITGPYIGLVMIGMYAMIAKRNLVKKIIGMNIVQTAVILFLRFHWCQKGQNHSDHRPWTRRQGIMRCRPSIISTRCPTC